MWDGTTWFKDGPGGSMTVSVTTTRTISASISAGAQISVSDLVSTAQLSITTTVTGSVTTTIGHSYTHAIPANEYGNMKYGSWGYYVHWEILYRHSNCTETVVQTGTGSVPTTAVGWEYYSTTT
jgi:hypothetical protein